MRYLGPIFASLLLSSTISGCFVDLHKKAKDKDEPDNSGGGLYVPAPADRCTTNASTPCPQVNDCTVDSCETVPLRVHYMLDKDLGDSNLVRVEAFQNPQFTGKPFSTFNVTNFSAKAAGDSIDTDITIKPGEYYLRAFLAPESGSLTPYEYHDMQLVDGHPVGVYGALSHATKLVVSASAKTQPLIEIYLDKLFQKNSETPSEAYLRVLLSVSEGLDLPLHQTVVLELRKTTEMADHPIYVFHLPSENLRILGALGMAEFLTPSLAVGDYSVVAYLDTSANGLLDQGEPAAFLRINQQLAKISIREKRTETISLKMNAEQN